MIYKVFIKIIDTYTPIKGTRTTRLLILFYLISNDTLEINKEDVMIKNTKANKAKIKRLGGRNNVR